MKPIQLAALATTALAVTLAACSDRAHVDSAPAGSTDHSVNVIIHLRDRTVEQGAQIMERMADEAAAQKCGTRPAKVLRRAQISVNEMIVTFRCGVA